MRIIQTINRIKIVKVYIDDFMLTLNAIYT